tara:strand:- start:2191 stop:2613 length:423 start_codon:yes stop_codon:yes gene_type:complete
MAKPQKTIVTPMWVQIKAMYEAGTNGSDKYGTNFEIDGELDKLCCKFIDLMGEITTKFGFSTTVEDIKMDLWKERIWSLVENAGLLPEIAWRDDKESDRMELEDKWDMDDEDEDYDIESMEQTHIDSLINAKCKLQNHEA